MVSVIVTRAGMDLIVISLLFNVPLIAIIMENVLREFVNASKIILVNFAKRNIVRITVITMEFAIEIISSVNVEADFFPQIVEEIVKSLAVETDSALMNNAFVSREVLLVKIAKSR